MRASTALTDLICIRPGGKRVAVTVAIGHPYPRSEGDWGCAVAISGFDAGVDTIHGHDSLQALCLALTFVRSRLTAFVADGGRVLLSSTSEEFPFDAYFPSPKRMGKRRSARPAPRGTRRSR